MYNILKNTVFFLKKELESKFAFVKSEITEFTKLTMMGKNGIHFVFDTNEHGLWISFWNTGIFEIGTGMIDLHNDDDSPLFISYVPTGDFNNNNYPEKETRYFIKKINELIGLINEKYDVKLSQLNLE